MNWQHSATFARFWACRFCVMDLQLACSFYTGLPYVHSPKQIKLVETFADQAVIAIENTRLFEAEQQRSRELAESLEQQTATSEVLRVISTSPSELEPVFGAILANGARLCEASFGILALYENGAFRVAGMHNVPEAYAEYRRLNGR